jgi:cell division inhibitor SulA
MPEFVIEREIPGASKMSEEQIRAASLKSLEVLRQLGPEIRWLRSFVTDDKIFCIYFAPDEAMIREHGRLAGIPVDRVAAVRRILDPDAFQA